MHVIFMLNNGLKLIWLLDNLDVTFLFQFFLGVKRKKNLSKCYNIFYVYRETAAGLVIKHPLWDACLYLG